MNTMLSERHELNKIALLELKKDVEETREFSSYFSKMADLLLYVNEIYDTKERTLEQLKQWNRIWYEEISQEQYAHSFGKDVYKRQQEGFSDKRIAVERNGEIVPKGEYANVI